MHLLFSRIRRAVGAGKLDQIPPAREVGQSIQSAKQYQFRYSVVSRPDDRVLLMRYDDAPPNGHHWSTPGGGLNKGEGYPAAAVRELARRARLTPTVAHVEGDDLLGRISGLTAAARATSVSPLPAVNRPSGS